MSKHGLGEIEELRMKFVKEIERITGLPLAEISVDVSLTSKGEDSPMLIEARDLDWHLDKEGATVWYTTAEIPQGGSTTIFVE